MNIRNKEIRMFKFWFVIIYESVVGILFLIFLVQTIIHWDSEKIINAFSIGTIITLIGLAPRFRDMYILSARVVKMKIRKEQEELWNDNHPEYMALKNTISDLEQEKRELQMI